MLHTYTIQNINKEISVNWETLYNVLACPYYRIIFTSITRLNMITKPSHNCCIHEQMGRLRYWNLYSLSNDSSDRKLAGCGSYANETNIEDLSLLSITVLHYTNDKPLTLIVHQQFHDFPFSSFHISAIHNKNAVYCIWRNYFWALSYFCAFLWFHGSCCFHHLCK